MSEHLKYFKTLQEADGYIINDIPWVGYVEETEQTLYCKEEDCGIVVNNNLAEVVELCILRYNATAKLTQADNLGTVSKHEWDSSTGDGRVIYDESVTSIGQSAFYNCTSLISITIPNSITSMGDNAFQGCSGLTSVHISDLAAWCNISFGSTLANPLTYAHNLYLNDILVTNLTIPSSITIIGNNAFYNCTSLTSVTIPNSVTIIGNSAFSSCSSLTSVTIPNSVTSIGTSAFSNCTGLTSVTIGNSVTSIGNYAFYYCSGLTSVTIPDSVNIIEEGAFGFCGNLTSATIPNSVTSIGDKAFTNCYGLTSVTIPNSVTSIGKRAFYWCYSLTSVDIGNSVISIRSDAFYQCTSLTSIACRAITPPSLGSVTVWNQVNKSIPVYVPAGSVSAYQSATWWNSFTNIQAIS